MYASGEYQFARRWFAGGRYDYSQRPLDSSLVDKGGAATLTFWPSEFSQVAANTDARTTRRARHRTSSCSSSCSRSGRTARMSSRACQAAGRAAGCRSVTLRACAQCHIRERSALERLLRSSSSPAPWRQSPRARQGKLNVVTTTEDLRRLRARSAATHHRRVDRARLSGSAFRRGEAKLHPQAPEGAICWSWSAGSSKSAGCRR